MSERKQAQSIFFIEIFDDNIVVIQYGDKKETLKLKNPFAILPMLLSTLFIAMGSEKVKDVETWLNHVWIKRIKRD